MKRHDRYLRVREVLNRPVQTTEPDVRQLFLLLMVLYAGYTAYTILKRRKLSLQLIRELAWLVLSLYWIVYRTRKAAPDKEQGRQNSQNRNHV